jgi:hypothetical protein
MPQMRGVAAHGHRLARVSSAEMIVRVTQDRMMARSVDGCEVAAKSILARSARWGASGSNPEPTD